MLGIYSKNREEWVDIDMANMKNSVVTVGFYDTLGPAAVEYILKQTQLTTIACSSDYLPAFIKLKQEGKAEQLANIVSFDKVGEDLRTKAKELGLNFYDFQEVVDAGKNLKTEFKPNEPTIESIYMFCYTSGTTGNPKAAMLSHGNFLSASAAAKVAGINLDTENVHISYLPLAHSFEKVLFCIGITNGCSMGFYSGDPLKLLDDMQVLKPTVFISVPRIFNRIYDRITQSVAEKSAVQQYLFNKAVQSKLYYLE